MTYIEKLQDDRAKADARIRELETRVSTLTAEVMHYTAGTPHPRVAQLEALVNRAIGVCQRYVPPEGPSSHDAMTAMLEIFDGPEQRAAMPQTETKGDPAPCEHKNTLPPSRWGPNVPYCLDCNQDLK